MTNGHIYLVQNSAIWKDNVAKLGRSENVIKRISDYGSKVETLRLISTNNYIKVEVLFLKRFKEEFKIVQGREYFEGDVTKMMILFDEITNGEEYKKLNSAIDTKSLLRKLTSIEEIIIYNQDPPEGYIYFKNGDGWWYPIWEEEILKLWLENHIYIDQGLEDMTDEEKSFLNIVEDLGTEGGDGEGTTWEYDEENIIEKLASIILNDCYNKTAKKKFSSGNTAFIFDDRPSYKLKFDSPIHFEEMRKDNYLAWRGNLGWSVQIIGANKKLTLEKAKEIVGDKEQSFMKEIMRKWIPKENDRAQLREFCKKVFRRENVKPLTLKIIDNENYKIWELVCQIMFDLYGISRINLNKNAPPLEEQGFLTGIHYKSSAKLLTDNTKNNGLIVIARNETEISLRLKNKYPVMIISRKEGIEFDESFLTGIGCPIKQEDYFERKEHFLEFIAWIFNT